jgi:serine/threonine protein kinase
MSTVMSEGSSRGSKLNNAFRDSREWQLREANISNLESQQRRLKRELALLGPKQQQKQRHERGRLQAQDAELVGGMPRSGWGTREIEDRYRLLKKLKGGAMAVVYMAEDKSTTAFYHEVVLKVLMAGATFESRQRMIREVSLVGSVRHPNVVSYLDAGEQTDGTMFIAMEVIYGRDLQKVIDANQRLHPIYTVEVLTAVTKGLQALHARQIVHRDLKPANVIVSPETGHVKIIDLGLAKHLQTESLLTGENVVGKS